MILPFYPLAVPSAEQMEALDAFGALAKARVDLMRLYALIPAPSLASRLSAADHVLVRQYESLVVAGQGLEAAAILALHHAPHVRLATQRRVA
jgi:hypothetical protein